MPKFIDVYVDRTTRSRTTARYASTRSPAQGGEPHSLSSGRRRRREATWRIELALGRKRASCVRGARRRFERRHFDARVRRGLGPRLTRKAAGRTWSPSLICSSTRARSWTEVQAVGSRRAVRRFARLRG